MIRVVEGVLSAQDQEGLVCPIRSDLAPLNVAARDMLMEAGPSVDERLRQMGPLPVGGAFMTPAGSLKASYIIHVVTAAEDEPETPHAVQRALRNALRRAAEWEVASLALPPLGMGVGNMDPEGAARAMVEILVNHLNEGLPPLDLTIVASTAYEADLFRRLASESGVDRFGGGN